MFNAKKGEKFIMASLEKDSKSKFSEILSMLRKERGYSQKRVATDLGISQALLSHYEKGVRECGLEFVVKASQYYGVTTDFMLGVSENRFGMNDEYIEKITRSANLYPVNKITNATKLLIDTAVSATNDPAMAKYFQDYHMLCLYRGALTLAKSGVLPIEMFKLSYTIGHELATAAISVLDARFAFIEDRSRTGDSHAFETDLRAVVEQAEEYLLTQFIA